MGQFDFEYLGPYRVEGILGRGGMGTVYKARHAKSSELFAIKVIGSSVADQPRFRRRFAIEVETLKRLKHPTIVQLIGHGEEQGLLFYSMEYVDGHSLHDHLRQHGRIPWHEVVQVGIDVCAALKHAHDFGIIHRDLKPANLMVTKEGTIKLTDFGIAKLFGATDMTVAGSVIGTADYMPPEQAEGKGVTVRSDLYSLGSVLYCLLAGRPPFGGKSIPEVLYAVRYNSVPDLVELVPDIPRSLAELIHELLEKDPLKRPPTALVVGNRLKSLQAGLEQLGTISPDETTKPASKKTAARELSSLDLTDDKDPDLKYTKPSHDSPEYGTEAALPSLFPQGSKQATIHSAVTSLNQPVTRPSDAEKPATSASKISGPSHFIEVKDDEPRPYLSEQNSATTQTGFDWGQAASVAGLIALLLISVGLGWWMTRPRSADTIYAIVMAAAESGDDGELLAIQDVIQEFVDRFPDDPRRTELELMRDEADLVRWTRVLRQRAGRRGGPDELSAIEQAFLDCMNTRGQDTAAAKELTRAFLTVFGQLKKLSPSDQRLVRLADLALAKMNSAQSAPVPPASTDLEELIRHAESTLPKHKLAEFYASVIKLYEDKPWARDHLSRLRQLSATPKASGR